MPDEIFISYSREDEAFARRLAVWLTKTLGVGVWIDIEDIAPGIKWSAAIQEGLDHSQVMVVIITPASMSSTNVEDEWQYYLDQDKPVVPILLKSASLPFQLRRIQYIDFSVREEHNESLRQLVMEIRRHIIPTEAETIAAKSKAPTQTVKKVTQTKAAQRKAEERKRRSRRKNMIIGGLTLLTLTLAAAVAFLVLVVLEQEDLINVTILRGAPDNVRIYSGLDDTVGRPYAQGDTVKSGERVETSGDTVAALSDEDGCASAILQENSSVMVEAMDEERTLIGVDGGNVSANNCANNTEIQTPNGIDVTGSSARTEYDDAGQRLTVECPDGCDVTDSSGEGAGTTVQLAANEGLAIDTTNNDLRAAERLELWGEIVFSSRRRGGPPELFIMNRDGSNPRQLTDNSDADEAPTWSPDGSQIAFVRRNADIYLIDLSDPNRPSERNLTGDLDLRGENAPAWSPDGTQIAFTATSGIGTTDVYVLDINGENLRQITVQSGADDDPVWSPDGRQLAFTSTRDGQTDIYTIVLDDPDAKFVNITNSSDMDSEPAWSPDGTQIAFVRGTAIDSDIYLIPAAPGNVAQLLIDSNNQDTAPMWSPSGKYLVFVSQREGNDDIYVAPVDNPGAATNLTNMTGSDDESPAWVPIITAGVS